MLDSKGFDLWADGYDVSVGLSDEDDTYPFAGYKNVLASVYAGVMEKGPCRVLDIGFGTGVLTAKLYEAGCGIYGQDFSPNMVKLAKDKMPDAHLVTADFAEGIAEELKALRYDAVVATYSLHHIEEEAKPGFLRALTELLAEGGTLFIGDVAFETRAELELCRETAGDEWDDEESYFVIEELLPLFPSLGFEKLSHCAGVLTLRRD